MRQGDNESNGEEFYGTVLDTCMVDRQQLDLYTQIGRMRSPFCGISEWPWIDEALESASGQFLQDRGYDEWVKQTGGVYRQDKPYCAMSSPLTTSVVTQIADTTGGLLWADGNNVSWAVRLVPSADRSERFGLCIHLDGDARMLDPSAREQYVARLEEDLPKIGHDERNSARDRLVHAAHKIRLFSRAEQILWFVHSQVLRQRSSVVRLPDVILRQLIWGASPEKAPQDWRQEINHTLYSLTQLRTEVLQLPKRGWQPRLGAHSVCLAHLEDASVTSKLELGRDACTPCCPMYGHNVRHHHFVVQIGYGFLGILEHFAIEGTGQHVRKFDFRGRPNAERPTELGDYQKRGGTPSVNLPAKIFGPAKWAGLSPEVRELSQGLWREITRVRKKTRSDQARVFRGDLVPGAGPHQEIVCPLLRPGQKYVAFGGNKNRPGTGYGVIGKKGTGWLHKCGYPISHDSNKDLSATIRKFFVDLRFLADILDLTVAGLDLSTSEWLDLNELMGQSKGIHGWEKIYPLQLRIYAPEDYQDRLRRYFEARGGFTEIPGRGTLNDSDRVAGPTNLDLQIRVGRLGLTQNQLAQHLGVSQSFISQIFSGRRQWPETVARKAEVLIERAGQDH